MNDKLTFETDDIALASYLKMKGVDLVRYDQSDSKVVFHFADSNVDGTTECRKKHVEFLNSECKLFDSFVRDFKKMVRRRKQCPT